MIPEAIKQKILKKYPTGTDNALWLSMGAVYGYELSQEEIETLKAWKQEALSVMPDYQAIGRALGIKLGESVHDKILPGIEKLKEENARLRRYLDEYDKDYAKRHGIA